MPLPQDLAVPSMFPRDPTVPPVSPRRDLMAPPVAPPLDRMARLVSFSCDSLTIPMSPAQDPMTLLVSPPQDPAATSMSPFLHSMAPPVSFRPDPSFPCGPTAPPCFFLVIQWYLPYLLHRMRLCLLYLLRGIRCRLLCLLFRVRWCLRYLLLCVYVMPAATPAPAPVLGARAA